MELHGLSGRRDLNGAIGTVRQGLDPASGRVVVVVAGQELFKLKPANLRVVGSSSSAPAAFDDADFSCSICHSLLWKPCVNVCGHAFCFWCIHQAMEWLQDSHCPLCRTGFSQLAFPCAPMHRFLLRAFPEKMAARSEEVALAERNDFKTESPAIDLEGAGATVTATTAAAGAEDTTERGATA